MQVTQEGYDKLKAELEQLEREEKPKVARLLKDAIAEGDLSENAAYDEAKNRQAMLGARIRELQATLKKAVIEVAQKSDTVRLGSKVTVKNSDNAERVFTITSQQDASPAEGKISYDSPLGGAFMHHKKGDQVVASTPAGEKKFTILEIA